MESCSTRSRCAHRIAQANLCRRASAPPPAPPDTICSPAPSTEFSADVVLPRPSHSPLVRSCQGHHTLAATTGSSQHDLIDGAILAALPVSPASLSSLRPVLLTSASQLLRRPRHHLGPRCHVRSAVVVISSAHESESRRMPSGAVVAASSPSCGVRRGLRSSSSMKRLWCVTVPCSRSVPAHGDEHGRCSSLVVCARRQRSSIPTSPRAVSCATVRAARDRSLPGLCY